MNMLQLQPCQGCRGDFPAIAGPTHRYMESSPGCWAAYCAVLAREYGDPTYGRLHRLTVDAYAVQHPGGQSAQAIQSVAVHLISLYLVLERSEPAEEATRMMRLATEHKSRYIWLSRPDSHGAITVADVQAAQSVDAHLAVVRTWAETSWRSWVAHHNIVRSWADELRRV